MASVPNTSTFTLFDVVNAVGGANDLVGLFANAVPSAFDPVYEGTKNNLLNFRNYDEAVVDVFSISPTTLNFGPTGSSLNVTLTSSSAWTLSVPSVGWISASPTTGAGNATVQVNTGDNATGSTRNVNLTFTQTSSGLTQVLSVSQTSSALSLILAPSGGGTYPASGDFFGLLALRSDNNENWTTDFNELTYSVNVPWITLGRTAPSAANVVIDFNGGGQRIGLITVASTSTPEVETYSVFQLSGL